MNWSSDDQKSTVKIFSQTLSNLKLAFEYLINKNGFMKRMLLPSKPQTYISRLMYNNAKENYDIDAKGNFVSFF